MVFLLRKYNQNHFQTLPKPCFSCIILRIWIPRAAKILFFLSKNNKNKEYAIQKLQRRKSGKIPAAKSVMVPYQTSLEKTQIQVHLKGGPHGRVPGGPHRTAWIYQKLFIFLQQIDQKEAQSSRNLTFP